MKFPIEQRFKLTDAFIEKYKNIKAPFGYNGLGEFVYMRTYSKTKPDGKNESWYETVRRVVEGIYSIQKQHIDDYNLGWNQTKAQKSAQEMFDRMFNFKMLPAGRSLWSMGSPVVMDKGLTQSLYNCFSGEEKFLTKNGYKKFSESEKFEEVLTLSGEWKKSEIKSFGKQKIVELTLIRSGKTKTIRTTENHLWFANQDWNMARGYVYKLLQTSELEIGMRLKYQFASNTNSIRIPSPQGIQHGFMFGDGTKNRIDLQKGKDEDLLRFFGENRIKEKDGFYQITDLPEHYKEFPEKRWDKKYILGFLMGYFAADGSVSNGQITISSSKIENLEFFKEMGEVCGIGSYDIRLSSVSSNYSKERNLYQVTLIPSTMWEEFFILAKHRNNFTKEKGMNYWRVESVVYTEEKEIVYCAVVPEKECFVLSDGILTHNCSFLSTEEIKDDVGKPFANAMDFLMTGIGVGADTLGAGKVKIKEPGKKTYTYVVPDDREGWVESLYKLINSYFGEDEVFFDYSLVRKEGEPIKTFGGVSSGPKPLIELHDKVREILNKDIGKFLSITNITDIFNLIGKAVVAGNVRRSAEIILGKPENEFLDLKDYEKNPERIDYGWASNNTIFAELGMDYSEIAKRIKKGAEPGAFWLSNAQKYGRMIETEANFKDFRAKGLNP